MTSEDFEHFWYFDDKQDLDFWMWCIANRPLLEVLKLKREITFDDAIEASKKIYANGTTPDTSLYLNTITVAGFNEQSHRKEYAMYPVLAKCLEGEILGGPNQPDCLIKGIPLEAKVFDFNEKALKQLQRYMKKYKSNFGLAAGSELTVLLPESIFFIQVKFNDREYVIENLKETREFIRKVSE